VFKTKDFKWVLDAYKELSDYGISLTDENTTFNTKLNQIIKKHPFSRSLTIPVNGVVASYFEFLKSIDDETDIQKNIEMLKIENVQLLQMDVFQYLSTCKNQYDVIFAGPPYALNTIDQLPKIIVEQQLISPEGYFILEHTPRNNYKNYPGYSFERNYGTTIFSFFE
jgi:hypothetical protein